MKYKVILAFKQALYHVIWVRIDVMVSKIKHPIIGTVFLPSIISAIHPLYQPKSL
jgi:hypothetical protein